MNKRVKSKEPPDQAHAVGPNARYTVIWPLMRGVLDAQMKPKEIATRFKHLLPVEKTFEAGFETMLGLYENERVDGTCLGENGDMLLFQWGTHDWGDGEHFQIDITRQIIWDTRTWFTKLWARPAVDYQAIWQLSLTFRFSPTYDLRKLESGNHWCGSPAGLPQFRSFVDNHKAYQSVRGRLDGELLVNFGDAE